MQPTTYNMSVLGLVRNPLEWLPSVRVAPSLSLPRPALDSVPQGLSGDRRFQGRRFRYYSPTDRWSLIVRRSLSCALSPTDGS
jgi:hypothetical protein